MKVILRLWNLIAKIARAPEKFESKSLVFDTQVFWYLRYFVVPNCTQKMFQKPTFFWKEKREPQNEFNSLKILHNKFDKIVISSYLEENVISQ